MDASQITGAASSYARKCDNVNKHFISLINEWLLINPDMVFFIENPRGMLRKMPAVNYFKTGQVNLLETRLKSLVKEMLLEKKTKRDRCLRIADRKFDKPSAYKSGAVVRCRKGDIWKDIKEEKETLRTWFKRQGAPGKTGGWVDCNSPIRKDGEIVGYKPCGRQKGEERAKYPSCRPTASKCKDPGKGKTWGKTKNESLDKLKETPNPQSGKAAPYGSGYAPIKNKK